MKTYVFGDYVEASIAAARLRSEGFTADVFDESVASLWGPMAVGGVRVLVSESAGPEETEVLENSEFSEGKTDRVLRWFFVAMFLTGVVVSLLGLVAALVSNPVNGSFLIFAGFFVAASWVFLLSLIAESTKRFVRYPLVLGFCALVLVGARLFIG